MNPGPWGILIIVIAILLLFGRGKIAGMMGEIASGIKSFQKGLRDDDEKPISQIDASAKSEAESEAETVKRNKDS